ncbi:hypothetical protein J7I84_07200 [Arthrobacter sp. ISL-85]|uniref:hypothetical protein n=1 Tax=Arthrobacter sp. ISL-85 TaxID=2819115 RepID=UPI001BE7196B|nr:hypothetical protein [Arthrobacter sp. ISL-85]MBT2566286.1 hypothetical protein [Arthrobacter sp. ISL-85]
MEAVLTAPVLTVTVTDRDSRDVDLEAAVIAMREQALLGGRQGILVTRHAPGKFTVELSDDVPFGFTHERDATI